MEKNPKEIYNELGLITLNDLAAIENSFEMVPFGDPIFDQFLNGGLRPGLLTEICGEAGTGKSQLALQMMLNALLNQNKNEIVYSCYYISTQKPLNETRMDQLKTAFLKKYKLKNPQDLENRLILKHATNLHDFNFYINNDLNNKLEDNRRERIRVVVIDTIAGICGEFVSNTSKGVPGIDTFERRNFILKTSQQLKKYAVKYNIAVLTINNMTSSLNEDTETYKKEKLVPALGLIWSNTINERFKLKKVKAISTHNLSQNDIIKEKVKRIFKVKFSPRFPKKKMEYTIEKDGIFGLYTPK